MLINCIYPLRVADDSIFRIGCPEGCLFHILIRNTISDLKEKYKSDIYFWKIKNTIPNSENQFNVLSVEVPEKYNGKVVEIEIPKSHLKVEFITLKDNITILLA